MREITVTADDSGTTIPVVVDQYIAPNQFNIVANGGISGYSGTFEYSLTDPYPFVNGKFVEADYTWVQGSSGFQPIPFRAVRLNGAAEGDTLTVVQAGAL
jgi:hypothetical protein